MKRRHLRTSVTAFCLAALLSSTAALAQTAPQTTAPRPAPRQPAQPVEATPRILAFDKFMKASSLVCEKQASTRCVDAGWRHADQDKDGFLTLTEFERIREDLGNWIAWKGEGLSQRDRASLGMGLWVADSAGLANVFKSYDTNGDKKLSRTEALADVQLDSRPLGKVLTDKDAVDRTAFAKRLGPLAKMAEVLMQPRPAPGTPTPAPRAPRPQAQPLPPP